MDVDVHLEQFNLSYMPYIGTTKEKLSKLMRKPQISMKIQLRWTMLIYTQTTIINLILLMLMLMLMIKCRALSLCCFRLSEYLCFLRVWLNLDHVLCLTVCVSNKELILLGLSIWSLRILFYFFIFIFIFLVFDSLVLNDQFEWNAENSIKNRPLSIFFYTYKI